MQLSKVVLSNQCRRSLCRNSSHCVMNALSTYLEKYLSRKYLNWKIPAEWVAGSAEWVAGSAVKLGIFSDFWRGAGRPRQKSKKMLKKCGGISAEILAEIPPKFWRNGWLARVFELSTF